MINQLPIDKRLRIDLLQRLGSIERLWFEHARPPFEIVAPFPVREHLRTTFDPVRNFCFSIRTHWGQAWLGVQEVVNDSDIDVIEE